MSAETAPASLPDSSIVAETVARYSRAVPSVEEVYVRTTSWGFECWLVANESTREERFRLYDIEWEIMELLPEAGFKFHLVDRLGQSLCEIVTLEHADAVIRLHEKQDA